MKQAAKKPRKVPVIDPYLPHNGNFGYRVSRYELDLESKVASNRLAGTATITAVTLASLQTFTLNQGHRERTSAGPLRRVGGQAANPASRATAGRLGDVDHDSLWRSPAADPKPLG